MAIALDSSSGSGVSTSSLSYSHTISGSDRILIMGVTFATGTSINGTPTYGGVSMTQIDSVIAAAGSTFSNTYFFYLLAPTVGTANIVINGSTSNYIYSSAISYTGVDQTNPIDASGSFTQASSTSITKSITTTADNCWLSSFTVSGTANSISAGTNVTQRQNIGPGWCASGDTNAAQTPAGSYGQTWTGASDSRALFVVALKPAVGVSVNSGFLAFM